MSLPLAGCRVLVTRAVHQSSKLSDGLRAVGAEPVEVPVLDIRSPESFQPLDHALGQLNSYDWLIFTSANTVRALLARAEEQGITLAQSPPTQKIAAIGSATAEAARQAGFEVALIPDSYVAESLMQGIVEQAAGQHVLLARAAVARDVIPDALRRAGAVVDVVDAYRNVLPENAADLLQSALTTPIDAATFTSSSTATHLAEAARRAGLTFPLSGVAAVSIGPVTSQTLRELGWEPAAQANPSDIHGLMDAVVRLLNKNAPDVRTSSIA